MELEAAAAFAASQAGGGVVADKTGDPWALRRDAVAAAAMSRRGPLLTGDTSPFAGSVALELLPRTPPWLALELRRSAGALRRTAALALATLGVEPAAPPPPPSPRPIKTPTGRSYGAHDADHSDGLQGPPDDVLAREMRFVRALCDVAEAMRGVDGSSRPARLRKELEALPRRTPLAHAPFEKAGRLGTGRTSAPEGGPRLQDEGASSYTGALGDRRRPRRRHYLSAGGRFRVRRREAVAAHDAGPEPPRLSSCVLFVFFTLASIRPSVRHRSNTPYATRECHAIAATHKRRSSPTR